MDFSDEDACRKVIGEQRDQLMQLREQLRQFKQRPLTLVPDVQKIIDIDGTPWATGRTVGLKIPDDLRERLVTQQEARGLKSYRQVVSSCIALGLRMMEGNPHVQSTMEVVNDVSYPSAAAG